MITLHRELTHDVIGAAIEVHRLVGPGLLESTYARCLRHELSARRIPWRSEVPIDIQFKGLYIESAYRADLVVASVLVVELKCVDRLTLMHEAQALTQMRWLGAPVGLLLNFKAPVLVEGLKRLMCPSAGSADRRDQ